MIKLFLFLTVVCAAFSAKADDVPNTSLFFTPDEVQKIENLLAKKPVAAAAEKDVHLGAVFFYAPNDWVLWLQGERWTPATRRDDVKIVKVTSDQVKLVIASAAAPREVTLKPFQTYQGATGRVVEGAPDVASASPELSAPSDSK